MGKRDKEITYGVGTQNVRLIGFLCAVRCAKIPNHQGRKGGKKRKWSKP